MCCGEQGVLVPQLPAGDEQPPGEHEASEEALERLAHLEQLVVQLKELIRDKDTQLVQKDTELASKDAQFKVNNLLVAPLYPGLNPFISYYSWLITAGLFSCFFLSCTVFFASHQQTEKEEADARFTKLKLQAKAKMASLNKQIAELKGGATVRESDRSVPSPHGPLGPTPPVLI